jgi:hypothetical protein
MICFKEDGRTIQAPQDKIAQPYQEKEDSGQ